MKIWTLILCGLCAACAHGKPTLAQATEATLAATNVTYGIVVELCDAKEKAIIARPPSTLERDKADIAHVREVCEQIFATFEQTSKLSALVDQLELIR